MGYAIVNSYKILHKVDTEGKACDGKGTKMQINLFCFESLKRSLIWHDMRHEACDMRQ